MPIVDKPRYYDFNAQIMVPLYIVSYLWLNYSLLPELQLSSLLVSIFPVKYTF